VKTTVRNQPRKSVSFGQQLRLAFQLFLIMAVVEVINMVSGRFLNQFGLIPRETMGLIGIVTSPFIHGNLTHFLGNMPPLLLFTVLVLEHGRTRFWLASIGIVILGGAGVWLFGRASIHIGASGLVFGYFGYLFVAGFISKEFKLLSISIFVAVLYGGMLWGVLPTQPMVSFESHLFGLIAGIMMALLVGRAKR
jgi:membrane associated rhomboid family serine protease